MAHLATMLYRRRYSVLLSSVLFFVIALASCSRAIDSFSPGGYGVSGSASLAASDLLNGELIQTGDGTPDLIVLLHHPTWTVTDPPYLQAVRQLVARLRHHPEIIALTSYYSTGAPTMVSYDHHQTILTLRLSASTAKQRAYRALLPLLRSPTLQVTVGGSAAAAAELDDVTALDLRRAELWTAPLVALLLVVIFRSLLAALLPLLIAGLAITGALAALLLLTHVTPVSIFALDVVTMVAFGLAVDYALLIVTRFREELAHAANDVPRALRRTLSTAGRTVLFAGLIVSLSLSGLLLFPVTLLRSIGLGAIAAVAMDLLAALTVLPALLAVLGPRVNALSFGRSRVVTSGFWAHVAERAMARPLVVAGAIVTLFVVVGLPVQRMTLQLSDLRVLPSDQSARIVGDQLAHAFPHQSGASAVVAVRTVGGATERDNVARLYSYVQSLGAVPGVSSVDSIVTMSNRISLLEYQQLYTTHDPLVANVLPSYVQGDVQRIGLSLSAIELSSGAEQTVQELRSVPLPSGLTALVGGATASQADLLASFQATLPLALAIIVLTTFMLLYMMTRSLVVPLKTLVINTLSLSVAYGALVWVLQDGHLHDLLRFTSVGSLDPTQPIVVFAVTFGLSMDYEVFLLGRIQEEYRRSGDNDRAVVHGIQQTGPLITSAALLLAVVVGSIATGRIVFMKGLGIGIAVAIVMDATIIRMMLVPATMKLLGRWNWWAPSVLGGASPRHGRARRVRA